MPRNSDISETREKTQTRGRKRKTTQPDIPTLVIDVPDIAPGPSDATPESPVGIIGFAKAGDAYFFTPPSSPHKDQKPRWAGIKGLDAFKR